MCSVIYLIKVNEQVEKNDTWYEWGLRLYKKVHSAIVEMIYNFNRAYMAPHHYKLVISTVMQNQMEIKMTWTKPPTTLVCALPYANNITGPAARLTKQYAQRLIMFYNSPLLHLLWYGIASYPIEITEEISLSSHGSCLDVRYNQQNPAFRIIVTVFRTKSHFLRIRGLRPTLTDFHHTYTAKQIIRSIILN